MRNFIPAHHEQVKADVGETVLFSDKRYDVSSADGVGCLRIDLRSNESMVVGSGLIEGSYGGQRDGSRLAWQEARYLPVARLHLMDLNTSQKQEIAGRSNDYARACWDLSG